MTLLNNKKSIKYKKKKKSSDDQKVENHIIFVSLLHSFTKR